MKEAEKLSRKGDTVTISEKYDTTTIGGRFEYLMHLYGIKHQADFSRDKRREEGKSIHSTAQVNKWIKNTHTISSDKADVLCREDFTDTDPSYLLYGIGYPTKEMEQKALALEKFSRGRDKYNSIIDYNLYLDRCAILALQNNGWEVKNERVHHPKTGDNIDDLNNFFEQYKKEMKMFSEYFIFRFVKNQQNTEDEMDEEASNYITQQIDRFIGK